MPKNTTTILQQYSDQENNEIISNRIFYNNVKVEFNGSNNKVFIDEEAKIDQITLIFDGDFGVFRIGKNKRAAFKGFLRIGHESRIILGNQVSTTGRCTFVCGDGASIFTGNDIMIASGNEIRAHDGHPIFDFHSGDRINKSRSIFIGSHVWLAERAALLKGSRVGDGSVVGFGSVVSGDIPNNSVAVGVPAQVRRRDITWERPHLTIHKPFDKPHSSSVAQSQFRHPTQDGEPKITLTAFAKDYLPPSV